MENKELIENLGESMLQMAHASMNKNINRYTLHNGKIYGDSSGKNRMKILRVQGDMIYYKDLVDQRVYSEDVDTLLPKWEKMGVKEIAFIDEIIDLVKKHLGPLLGPFIAGGLTSWLLQKLK